MIRGFTVVCVYVCVCVYVSASCVCVFCPADLCLSGAGSGVERGLVLSHISTYPVLQKGA